MNDRVATEECRLPAVVDLRLLGSCNLRCPFCFGPRHSEGFIGTHKWLRIISILPDYGVRRVVFTGGEPLLVPELPTLLSAARDVGLHCSLSTNGTLLSRRHEIILPHLQWIALPIDSVDRSMQTLLRPFSENLFEQKNPSSGLDTVIEAFKLCRKHHPQVKIKLGTVAMRSNLSGLADIPEFVDRECGPPDTWKIYQMSKGSYAQDNWTPLSVNDELFECTAQAAVSKALDLGWHVTVYRNSERSGKYVFIEPNGDAMVIDSRGERVVGNFLTDFGNAVTNVNRFIDEARLWKNAVDTYPE